MNYITTTQLRTKTKELLRTLKQGQTVDLIHRSKVVGEFRPLEVERPIFKVIELKKLLKDLPSLPRLSIKEQERQYRAAMERKHGKGLSRH